MLAKVSVRFKDQNILEVEGERRTKNVLLESENSKNRQACVHFSMNHSHPNNTSTSHSLWSSYTPNKIQLSNHNNNNPRVCTDLTKIWRASKNIDQNSISPKTQPNLKNFTPNLRVNLYKFNSTIIIKKHAVKWPEKRKHPATKTLHR